MVYGEDNNGENNGESLILHLLFEGIHTFLAFLKFCEENEMLFFFSSRVGILYP